MTEARPWHRERRAGRGEDPCDNVVGELSEHDDDAHSFEQCELPDEVRQAAVPFRGRGLVRRGCTAHGRGDVGAGQLQAVVGRDRRRLVGEAEPVERPEEPVAGTVPGEHPAGAVPAVRRRREPDHEDTGTRIAEAGYGASPVVVVSERRALLTRDLLAPLDEPRAGAAVDDLGGQRRECVRVDRVGHRGIVRVSFAAVLLRLVVNPIASSVTARARTPVIEALKAEHDLDIVETEGRGDAIRLARDAVAQGVDVVVVLGGDGTLNEAAAGLVGSTTALAALPGGSTNVFGRTLGVAHDPIDATNQLLRSLAARAFRRIGLGVAMPTASDDRPFLFHLGLGFDAAVVNAMEQRWYLKRYLAHPAFVVAAVDTWLRHFDRDTRICVSSGEDVIAFGPYAVVSNSDPYTYVLRRRLTISPHADLDRALAVTVLHHLGASLVVRAALSGIGTGRFVASTPDITQRGDLTRLSVTADRPFAWQVDGDYLGTLTRLDVRYEPDTLTLVVP